MGSTFLALTNSVLTHFGEVPLTSTSFANATGFHSVAKTAVLDAIRKIQQAEYEWPFNYQLGTLTLTPTSTAGGHTQEYAYYTATTQLTESIDWESFMLLYLATLGGSNISVAEAKVEYIDYDEWLQRYRSNDKNISYTDGSIRLPKRVYRTQNEKIGISPPPERAYQLTYDMWITDSDMSAYTDTTTIPSRFDHVIREGAFAQCYKHREDQINYNISNKAFKDGIAKMRELLINRFKYFRDNRTGRGGG